MKPKNENRGYDTYFKQLLKALKEASSEYVFITEHDVLYHPAHFKFECLRNDTFYHNRAVYANTKKGWHLVNCPFLSQYVGDRKLFIAAVEERLLAMAKNILLPWLEIGYDDPFTKFNVQSFVVDFPNVDIRHTGNATGDGLSNPNRIHIIDIPYWGNFKELREKMGLLDSVSTTVLSDNMMTCISEAYKQGMLQKESEIVKFLEYCLDKNIKTVLEIGTGNGGTFYLFSEFINKDGKNITIDNIHNEELRKAIKKWSNNNYYVTGDSHDKNTFLMVQEILKDEKIDLLFIDGDHSYNGVKKDYEMYKSMVRDGGFIVFHDIVDSEYHRSLDCNVAILWKELYGDKIEFSENHHWAGIGLIKNVVAER